MKNSGGGEKLSFFFSFISEEMGGEGVRVEVGEKGKHSKLQKVK